MLSDFNALENVYLSKLTINNDLITAKKDANKILNKMNLKNRQNHYPSELSGGEAQRVAISRAVINSWNHTSWWAFWKFRSQKLKGNI